MGEWRTTRIREHAFVNKWSKWFHIRSHRPRIRTVQSYSPGCVNVHPVWYTQIGIRMHHTACTLCWDALSMSTTRHVRICSGPATPPQNWPSCVESGPIWHMVPWAHQSPHPKPHLDRFSRFYKADGCLFIFFYLCQNKWQRATCATSMSRIQHNQAC